MLTLVSRAIGFLVCAVLMIIGLCVVVMKFIRNALIVAEVKDAKKRRDKKRAEEKEATSA